MSAGKLLADVNYSTLRGIALWGRTSSQLLVTQMSVPSWSEKRIDEMSGTLRVSMIPYRLSTHSLPPELTILADLTR
jgi:hypothetical protein